MFDKSAAGSTTPCFDEHLPIKVLKTRIYLIRGIRNPFEAESEKWQNTIQLSIGDIRKWVKRAYGLDISKSSVCSARDKCGADKLEPGAAKIVPKLKSKKELAVLEAFKALGFFAGKEEQEAEIIGNKKEHAYRREVCLMAETDFLPRLKPWVSIR